MEKVTKIITYILAAIGLASIVKHIHTMHSKGGCCLCGCNKTKVEDEKPAETESHTEKEEGEKITGSRYGSNPAKY